MDSFGSSDLQATFDDFGNGADDALHLQDLIAGGPNELSRVFVHKIAPQHVMGQIYV